MNPDSRMPHTDAMVVLTTVANETEGIALVRALLERRVIACGTLLPGARSIVAVALDYNRPNPPVEGRPRIARYALGKASAYARERQVWRVEAVRAGRSRTSFAGIYDLSWDAAGNRWWLVRVHD